MSNPGTSDHSDTRHPAAHGTLRALIESLHHMFIAVATRLRHMHVRDRKQMEHPKGSFDIWARIGSHIEQIHSEEEPANKPQIPPQPASAKPSRQRPYADVATAGASALGRYYTHKAVTEHHPHMDQVLRSRTMEHIGSALRHARNGDQASAKLHVGLAESAMHTASRFMDHDDYEVFEREVEHRLESLFENTPHMRKSAAA